MFKDVQCLCVVVLFSGIVSEVFAGDFDDCRFPAMKATVGETDTNAVVDTGTTISVIHGTEQNPALEGHSSSMIGVLIAGTIVQQRLYDMEVPVVVSGISERNVKLIETDIFQIPGFQESGVRLLIGMNYLRGSVLVLRGRETLAVFDSVPNEHPEEFIRLKFLRHGVPHVSMQLPSGLNRDVVVDTGYLSYLQLPAHTIDALLKAGHILHAEMSESGTARGIVVRQAYTLRWLELGSVRFLNVPVVESDMAIVGVELLRHLNSVFDFPNQKMYFEPVDGKSPIVCEVDASGLVYSFDAQRRAIIRRFRPNYPAEKAGISIGDELLAVDNVPVAKLSIHEIDSILCQGGKTVHLELKSGERTYEVDLPRSRPFEYPPQWEPERIPRVLPPQE